MTERTEEEMTEVEAVEAEAEAVVEAVETKEEAILKVN